VELAYIDVPYGSIDYSKQFAVKVEDGEVIFNNIPLKRQKNKNVLKN